MKVHRVGRSPSTTLERRRLRKRLRIALAVAGLTQAQFADRRCSVTEGHFSMWINGDRDSTVLDEIVGDFIAEQARKQGRDYVA